MTLLVLTRTATWTTTWHTDTFGRARSVRILISDPHMAHQLVLLVNLIGLLLIDTFFLADVNITQNIPATIGAGSEVRVTVTITKGDLTGFAKLQLDLPPGMSATAIETKGGSFTFADQKAKFIWMALPTTPSFKISYTLKTDATANGMFTVQGRLSYIEDNERKTYDLPAAYVEVTGGAPSMVAQTEASSKPTPSVAAQPSTTEEYAVHSTEEAASAMDLVSMGGGAPVGTVPVAVMDQAFGVAPIQGPGSVRAERLITPVSAQEMLVEVTVKKGDLRGFGKLQETIPAGFTAIEHRSSDAIFTAQDRVVKFVWLNLPTKSELTISYKIRSSSSTDGQYSIDGEFGYLLNDETQKAIVGTSRFFIGSEALKLMAQMEQDAKGIDQQDPALALRPREQPTKEPEPVKPTPTPTPPAAPVKEQPRRDPPVTATQPKTTIPAPEKGITYKVQITAAHREVGRAYFQARHRYSGNFSIERHEGWIKYVTGGFGKYQEARDHRVSLVQGGHQFPGPFVTAYNDGERITVQEALLISNQKWVQ